MSRRVIVQFWMSANSHDQWFLSSPPLLFMSVQASDNVNVMTSVWMSVVTGSHNTYVTTHSTLNISWCNQESLETYRVQLLSPFQIHFIQMFSLLPKLLNCSFNICMTNPDGRIRLWKSVKNVCVCVYISVRFLCSQDDVWGLSALRRFSADDQCFALISVSVPLAWPAPAAYCSGNQHGVFYTWSVCFSTQITASCVFVDGQF